VRRRLTFMGSIRATRRIRPTRSRASTWLECSRSPHGVRMGRLCAAGILVLLVPWTGAAETYIWVDDAGLTHLSDRAAGIPKTAQQDAASVDDLRSLWTDGVLGPVTATPPGSSGSDRDRVLRLLRGALQDLGRGETARASANLESVLRLDPRRPEAHWYLALLNQQRGRYQGAESHLRAFLNWAGRDLEPWRLSAKRRLADLADERVLADTDLNRGGLRLVDYESENFSIQMDADLQEVREEYATTAVRYLNEARLEASRALGVLPLEPLGVVFYGKAAYLRAHRHRFSFQTVGFFDGRIHVSSPAHPSGQLRSLLFHEYTHAVFREQTGGDRPYWLNEGFAELIERRSRKQPATTRSERALLRNRIQAGLWIPLRTLGPSFSGLTDDQARAAYLQAAVSSAWIERHSTVEQRALLMLRLSEGFSSDQSLYEVFGLDTAGLDAAVQAEIRGEFPSF
jgi:tetratricopeptide (TPR) repeat protein